MDTYWCRHSSLNAFKPRVAGLGTQQALFVYGALRKCYMDNQLYVPNHEAHCIAWGNLCV